MPPGKLAQRREVDAGAVEVPSDLIELGVLRGAYGLKGWVRIVPHDADAAALRAARTWWLKQGDGVVAREVTGVRRQGAGVVAKLTGCDSPEAAEELRGASVAVARGDFPAPNDGEFYWVDLIGARVINRAGVELGRVAGLRNNGAQDLLEVTAAAGAELLVPMVEDYVDAIDAKNGVIRVDWERDW